MTLLDYIIISGVTITAVTLMYIIINFDKFWKPKNNKPNDNNECEYYNERQNLREDKQ